MTIPGGGILANKTDGETSSIFRGGFKVDSIFLGVFRNLAFFKVPAFRGCFFRDFGIC